MRSLEFRTILNFFSGPLSIYGLLTHKVPRYVELRYIQLLTISN